MSERPQSKWIRFMEEPRDAKRKTPIFAVLTKDDADKGDGGFYQGDELGQVRWYSPWRRFTFFVSGAGEVLFESQCLRDIAAFCDWLMAERKAQRQAVS